MDVQIFYIIIIYWLGNENEKIFIKYKNEVKVCED